MIEPTVGMQETLTDSERSREIVIKNTSILTMAYAAAATAGDAGGASTLGGSSRIGAGVAAGSSGTAGFSRGAIWAGCSITGGFSSTLGGGETSVLALGLKNSPTRADKRRLTLGDFAGFSSF